MKQVTPLLAALLLLSTPGCSLCFVRGPSTEQTQRGEPPPPYVEPGDCTSGKAAPIIDTLIGGLQVVRTAAALSADDSVYQNAPITRGADVAAGVALTTLFLGSAIYGYVATSKCAKARDAETEYLRHAIEEDELRRRPRVSAPRSNAPPPPIAPDAPSTVPTEPASPPASLQQQSPGAPAQHRGSSSTASFPPTS